MWKQKPFVVVLASVLLMCCSVVVIKSNLLNSEDVESIFVHYVEQFNKSYRFNKDEYKMRFQKFQKSLAVINAMNTIRTHKESATFGYTEYSDMSHDEFVSTKLNANQSSQVLNRRNSIKKDGEKIDNWKMHVLHNIIRYQRDVSGNTYKLPERIDWRERGVVTEIRIQGPCGACWAHSVIGTIESMLAIEGNSSSLIQLSVQQMIDCAGNNNHGCQGGNTCELLAWLLEEKVNIQTIDEYPFNVEDTQCKMAATKSLSMTLQIKSFTCDSFVGQEDKLLYILAMYGPVVVAVNGLLWQNYLGGIIQFHCDGSIDSLNHAVQIVGYVPYYIARNSWGRKFGDRGYVKIQIGGNVCGIANQVSTINVSTKYKSKTMPTLS